MSRAYIFSWPASTTEDLLSARFLLEDFFASLCLRPGRMRTNLPVPVTLKRAATAFRVLNFVTMFLPLLSGAQCRQDDHLVSLSEGSSS